MPSPHDVDVLYCGDTSLEAAACYLGGLLTRAGRSFRYFRSDETPPQDVLESPWKLIVLSDYPAARLSREVQASIAVRIQAGAGLLMIGGWESFHGLGGDWDGTPLGELLPVVISAADDRLNCDHLVVVRSTAVHPITRGLPWEEHPPLIGGLNRVRAAAGGEVLLLAEHCTLSIVDGAPRLAAGGTDPLLVVGRAGAGRTAAFMSDVAPHWVGALVDWGLPRVSAQAEGAPGIEVGACYAELFTRLVAWTGGWLARD